MRPGRELDCEIAQHVFSHKVFVKKHALYELTPQGDRPLRNYSKDMGDAWAVVEKMNISILPIEGGQWFAFVGNESGGWKNPAEFIQFLGTGDFANAGAAVGERAAHTVCLAAMSAIRNRTQKQENQAEAEPQAPAIH